MAAQVAQVRHAGRESLQAALFQRAEGRFRARTVGAMAANLSSILMADLDLVRGKQVPYASVGAQPHSPYVKMDNSWATLQERAATAVRQAQQLDPEELRVLQRFYDQLCALVEAQRMSDPLCLMVVHKASRSPMWLVRSDWVVDVTNSHALGVSGAPVG